MDKEVYICYFDSSVIYVGSGNHGRHKHCTSGCSHVYELNKLHFSEDKDRVSVKVVATSLDKDESINLEKDLILKYTPRLNKVYLKNNQKDYFVDKKKVMDMFSKSLNESGYKVGDKLYTKYMETVSKFITQYKLTKLKIGITVSMKELTNYQDLRCFAGRLKFLTKSPYMCSIFDIENINGLYKLKLKDEIFN